MTVGYCDYHKKWLDPEQLQTKSCRCKENTGKRCKHLLKLKSTKDKYRNPSKGVRR